MSTRHAEARFAEACDGRLDDAARRRFEAHLAACPHCEDAYAEHLATVAAVRALPALRMPIPVRLPQAAPGRPHGWWVQVAGRRRSLIGAAGLLLAATAFVAAVSVTHRRGTEGPTASARVAAGAASSGGAAEATLAAPAPAPPGFTHRVSVSLPDRPGETLVVATESPAYARGTTVSVYAQLTGAPAGAAAVPAVRPDVRVLPAGATSVEGAAAPARASASTPLAVAAPGSPAADGTPLLRVVLPASLAPGAAVDVVATVPPASPGGSPITAVLRLTVT